MKCKCGTSITPRCQAHRVRTAKGSLSGGTRVAKSVVYGYPYVASLHRCRMGVSRRRSRGPQWGCGCSAGDNGRVAALRPEGRCVLRTQEACGCYATSRHGPAAPGRTGTQEGQRALPMLIVLAPLPVSLLSVGATTSSPSHGTSQARWSGRHRPAPHGRSGGTTGPIRDGSGPGAGACQVLRPRPWPAGRRLRPAQHRGDGVGMDGAELVEREASSPRSFCCRARSSAWLACCQASSPCPARRQTSLSHTTQMGLCRAPRGRRSLIASSSSARPSARRPWSAEA